MKPSQKITEGISLSLSLTSKCKVEFASYVEFASFVLLFYRIYDISLPYRYL